MNSILSKGNFIKWSDTDEEGSFSYVGQVLKVANKVVTFMLPNGGEISVPTNDGTFTKAKKPAKWNVKAEPTKRTATIGRTSVQKAVTRAKRVTGGPSKKDQAIDLYKQFYSQSDGIHMARKDAIQMFVEQLDMTPAGASTYVAMVRKIVTQQENNNVYNCYNVHRWDEINTTKCWI